MFRTLPLPGFAVPVWALVLGAAVLLSFTFYASLPDVPIYRGLAVYLEGPVPFIIGAALGVWLHRTSPGWLMTLGACGCAVAFAVAGILLLGTVFKGPVFALRSTYNVLGSSAVILPFSLLPEAWGTSFFTYILWTSVRSVVIWGGIAYGVLIAFKPETRRRVRVLFDTMFEERAFDRHQRQLYRQYRAEYVRAVNAGQPPPPPPPELLPATQYGRSFDSYARSAFWVLRIVLLLVGAAWGWALIDQYVYAAARSVGFPLFFGR